MTETDAAFSRCKLFLRRPFLCDCFHWACCSLNGWIIEFLSSLWSFLKYLSTVGYATLPAIKAIKNFLKQGLAFICLTVWVFNVLSFVTTIFKYFFYTAVFGLKFWNEIDFFAITSVLRCYRQFYQKLVRSH